ncbi:MAG: hypothetical protein U1E46_08725 [Hyphomicrobiales bacterium]
MGLRNSTIGAIVLALFAGAGSGPLFALPGAKDQMRIQQNEGEPGTILPRGGNPGLPVPGASGAPGETDPQTDLPSDQFTPTDQPPDVEDAQPVDTIELSDQVAKRALDAFALVKDKYKDTDIENYSSLDDFVSQTDAGKKFDADIKTFGFANVDEWNTAITTVSIAYSAVAENQEEEIKKQIEDLKNDSTLTDEARKKITESLLSMIPSENNKKIIRDLIADPGYDAKLKLLTQETD